MSKYVYIDKRLRRQSSCILVSYMRFKTTHFFIFMFYILFLRMKIYLTDTKTHPSEQKETFFLTNSAIIFSHTSSYRFMAGEQSCNGFVYVPTSTCFYIGQCHKTKPYKQTILSVPFILFWLWFWQLGQSVMNHFSDGGRRIWILFTKYIFYKYKYE